MLIKCECRGVAAVVNFASKTRAFFPPGAFGADSETELPLFFQHEREIGTAKIRTSANGVEVLHAEFILDDSQPADAWLFHLFRTGFLHDFSISVDPEYFERDPGPTLIRSRKLIEVSLCPRGASPLARIERRSWRALTFQEVLATQNQRGTYAAINE